MCQLKSASSQGLEAGVVLCPADCPDRTSRANGPMVEKQSPETGAWSPSHNKRGHTYQPLTPQVRLDNMLHTIAVCTAAQTSSRACSRSRSHTELAAFQVTWYVSQTNTPKWGMCSLQNPNRLLSRWWQGPLQNFFSFTLEGSPLHTLYHWVLRELTDVEGPWILVRLISHPLMCIRVTNNPKWLLPLAHFVQSAYNEPVWYLVEETDEKDPFS